MVTQTIVPVPRPAPGSEAQRAEMTLHLSQEALSLIARLMTATDSSPDVVIRRALGLYKAALAAKQENKAVGAASSADKLETEFVGF